METAIYIAQFLGVFYLIMGVAIIFNPVHYTTITGGFLKDPVVTFIGGAMSLAIGFLIIHAHNVWVKDWTVLITVIGWVSAVKGVSFLVFPDMTKKIYRSMLKTNGMMMFGGFITLTLGVVFSYYGFLMR